MIVTLTRLPIRNAYLTHHRTISPTNLLEANAEKEQMTMTSGNQFLIIPPCRNAPNQKNSACRTLQHLLNSNTTLARRRGGIYLIRPAEPRGGPQKGDRHSAFSQTPGGEPDAVIIRLTAAAWWRYSPAPGAMMHPRMPRSSWVCKSLHAG